MATLQNAPRNARAEDVPALGDIEVAAGRQFAVIGMNYVAGDEPLAAQLLQEYVDDGRAWVRVRTDDHPVAYLIVDVVDGNAHLEQVSVDPAYAHSGLGRSLIEHMLNWARNDGLPAVTLTTYTDVPWNGPYYARLGFRYLGDGELTDGLRAIRAEEAAHGLDRDPRACMRLDLSNNQST